MSAFSQSSENEVHFDVEIAIKVLRQAGYHSHAVFLAERHQHHEWYLKIQLEDLKVTCVFQVDLIFWGTYSMYGYELIQKNLQK